MESQGHGLYLIGGKLRMHLTHRFTDLGWRVETVEPVELNHWQHVAVTYDGKRMASGVRIYVDGKPQRTRCCSTRTTSRSARRTRRFASGPAAV